MRPIREPLPDTDFQFRHLCVEYFAPGIVIVRMNTAPMPVAAPYASGYAKGRQAAKGQVPGADNPLLADTSAYHGWNDGHYDERSARRAEIERYNTRVWSSRAS